MTWSSQTHRNSEVEWWLPRAGGGGNGELFNEHRVPVL